MASEVGPAADTELAIGPGEVNFDGVRGDEQHLGDVTVGVAGGGEFSYPPLAGGESVRAGRSDVLAPAPLARSSVHPRSTNGVAPQI